ncbi:MAG: hypothetical protein ACREH8_19355 [Opitutaceae bacterium]
MNASAQPFPAPRVTPSAAHAFGGIWRLTARRFHTPVYWLTLAGMLAVLVVFSIPAAPTHEAAARGFLPWAGGFYVCFLLPILAFISAAGAIRDDFGASSAAGAAYSASIGRVISRHARAAGPGSKRRSRWKTRFVDRPFSPVRRWR